MAKCDNGFDKDKKRASEAGKKTKRSISLKRTLKEFLQKQADENGKLSPENIIQAMTLHGMKGNSAMMKLMFEYVDGKVIEKVEMQHTATDELLDIIKRAYDKRKND